jgi:hypothetical protein
MIVIAAFAEGEMKGRWFLDAQTVAVISLQHCLAATPVLRAV